MHKKPAMQTKKYKTELCKHLFYDGFCPYGIQCKFAHSECEIVNIESPQRKKNCKTFFKTGYCPQGSRCMFKHDSRDMS